MTHHYKTIFISDLHLGSSQCQSSLLLDFLAKNHSEKLYLVGDIIDLWSLSKKTFWPAEHNYVIEKLLKKARGGTEIIYVPGNHDNAVRKYNGWLLGDIRIKNSDIHTTVKGDKLLVVHGDKFDNLSKYHNLISKVSSNGYSVLLFMNDFIKKIQRFIDNRTHSSFAMYLKNLIKRVSDYEANLIKALREMNLNGIVCGHLHQSGIKKIAGYQYMNTGDFVDSCTAIVEDFEGNMSVIEWRPVTL